MVISICYGLSIKGIHMRVAPMWTGEFFVDILNGQPLNVFYIYTSLKWVLVESPSENILESTAQQFRR